MKYIYLQGAGRAAVKDEAASPSALVSPPGGPTLLTISTAEAAGEVPVAPALLLPDSGLLKPGGEALKAVEL